MIARVDKSCFTCRFGESRERFNDDPIVVCGAPGLAKETIMEPASGDCKCWMRKSYDLMAPEERKRLWR